MIVVVAVVVVVAAMIATGSGNGIAAVVRKVKKSVTEGERMKDTITSAPSVTVSIITAKKIEGRQATGKDTDKVQIDLDHKGDK